MVAHLLDKFAKILENIDLVASIQEMKYGISLNAQNFFSILERYNP